MSSLPYFEVHAFAFPDRDFTGNPAGVCLMEDFPADAVLAGIAASNNLSETAFLVPRGEDVWHLRWFTPAIEVDLCGHATLASASVLFATGRVKGGKAAFDTRAGRLEVSRDDAAGFAMDLPAIGYKPAPVSPALSAALGLETAPQSVFRVDKIHGAEYQMWVMADEADVKLAEPDHGQLRRLNTNVILTAPGREVDFVSRFFAPASGVNEDPVTGSAHCTLTPYWTERLNRSRLTAQQIGPRPGALSVEDKGGRVTLFGHAPLYLSGEISLGR